MAAKRKRFALLGASIAPLIIVVLAGILSLNVADRFGAELLSRFEKESEDSLRLATVKLDNYRDLLYAGRAFVLSNESVTAGQWKSFYNQQSVFERYPGVSSIAYVESVTTEDLRDFEARMKTSDYFGPTYRLGQVSGRDNHGLATAYVSQNDLTALIGMDLLRLDDRYDVYKAAEAKGTVVASPPFKLATGYRGFFSVLPVYRSDNLEGYVLTSFRFDDLMRTLFADDSFGYEVTDVTTNEPQQLYRSVSYDPEGNVSEQVLQVGERRWKVVMTREVEERPAGYLLPAAIMTTALVLALTLYVYAVRVPGQRS